MSTYAVHTDILAYRTYAILESSDKVYNFSLFFTVVFNDSYWHVRIKVSKIALIKQSIPLVMEGLTERSGRSDCRRDM